MKYSEYDSFLKISIVGEQLKLLQASSLIRVSQKFGLTGLALRQSLLGLANAL